MAIDMSQRVTAGFFFRWMTVAKMKELLEPLRDDDELVPNRAGNLSVYRGGETIEMIGWIDFNEETFEVVDL